MQMTQQDSDVRLPSQPSCRAHTITVPSGMSSEIRHTTSSAFVLRDSLLSQPISVTDNFGSDRPYSLPVSSVQSIILTRLTTSWTRPSCCFPHFSSLRCTGGRNSAFDVTYRPVLSAVVVLMYSSARVLRSISVVSRGSVTLFLRSTCCLSFHLPSASGQGDLLHLLRLFFSPTCVVELTIMRRL